MSFRGYLCRVRAPLRARLWWCFCSPITGAALEKGQKSQKSQKRDRLEEKSSESPVNGHGSVIYLQSVWCVCVCLSHIPAGDEGCKRQERASMAQSSLQPREIRIWSISYPMTVLGCCNSSKSCCMLSHLGHAPGSLICSLSETLTGFRWSNAICRLGTWQHIRNGLLNLLHGTLSRFIGNMGPVEPSPRATFSTRWAPMVISGGLAALPSAASILARLARLTPHISHNHTAIHACNGDDTI